MRTVTALLLLFGAALVFPTTAEARPFSPKRIPAAAEGVIHLDVDALRASQLWKLAEPSIGDLEKALRDDEDLTEEQADLVLEVLGSVQSFTFWVDANEKGAMLVEVPNAGAIVGELKKMISAKPLKRGGVEMFRLSVDGDGGYFARRENTLIVGDDPDAVVASWRVLAGRAKSLSPGRLGATTTPANIFFVAGFQGQVMKALRQSAQARALSADIRGLVLYAGEHRDRAYIAARIETDSPATATKLSAVIKGLSALASIAADDPQLAKLAGNLSVATKGASLTARLEVPLDDIAALMAR